LRALAPSRVDLGFTASDAEAPLDLHCPRKSLALFRGVRARGNHDCQFRPSLSFGDLLTYPAFPSSNRSCCRSRLLSWDSFKDYPSINTNNRRPLPDWPRPFLRRMGANPSTCSVLVVPPDSDGLLRWLPCRPIASCSRSWGSPRFRFSLESLKSSPVALTLRSFSLSDHRSTLPCPCPSRRCLSHFDMLPCFDGKTRPQGCEPVEKSVARNGCCHPPLLDASMGL
jgi:hypothetical protein